MTKASAKTEKRQVSPKILWTLFLSTLSLSAFTFGGGYVIVPLMRKRFVDKLNWIKEDEMLDLIAIAQATPGSIAVNCSILVGYKIGGVLGAAVSLLGTVLPPFVIISLVAVFFKYIENSAVVSAIMLGMQAAIAAVIFDVVLNLAKNIIKKKNLLALGVMIVSIILVAVWNVSVIYILGGCILIGILTAFYEYRRKRILMLESLHGSDLDYVWHTETPLAIWQIDTPTEYVDKALCGDKASKIMSEDISEKPVAKLDENCISTKSAVDDAVLDDKTMIDAEHSETWSEAAIDKTHEICTNKAADSTDDAGGEV